MNPSFSAVAIIVLLVLVVAAAPIWPWSQRIGPRPMIVAALCLTVYTILTVWSL